MVVVGPAHRAPVHGLALSSASGFATPLGVVPTDPDLTAELRARPAVYVDDIAHGPEHCIEVQLPFLQRVLGPGWSVVPALAADVSTELLADVLEPLWGARDTLVVVSTDLSHYHPIDVARGLDRRTAASIVTRSWEDIGREHACGSVPLRAALELARRHHHQGRSARRADVGRHGRDGRSRGRVRQLRGEVIAMDVLSRHDLATLVSVARSAARAAVVDGRTWWADPDDVPDGRCTSREPPSSRSDSAAACVAASARSIRRSRWSARWPTGPALRRCTIHASRR